MFKLFDFFPGCKTYAVGALTIGMLICQGMGYHTFSPEEWSAVGVTGGIFWKMSVDRKK